MPNQQLIDYINQSRQKGMTDVQIRQELSAIGWSQSEIDEHLLGALQTNGQQLNDSVGGNVTNCPHCQKEISSKADRCPFCQSDLRSWAKRHIILTGTLILISLFTFIFLVSLDTIGSKLVLVSIWIFLSWLIYPWR